ncbi:MAG: response regulator [Chitinophagaceae bacterium]
MKKVIIIDDEAAGRKLIKEYLEEFPELILIAEINNGVDAVKRVNELKPDIIFLDIQMPGLSGFEVLTHLDEIPQIIFSTAYDKYALQAFEVHAIDYLLKPYTKERFKKAIDRLLANNDNNRIAPLAESLMMGQSSFPERILVNHNKKLITITVEQIVWIEAYGDYSKLHISKNSFLSNYGISVLEEKLNSSIFIRVHRSSIINLKHVRELDRSGKSYDIKMSNDDVVRASLGYIEKLKDLIF